MDLLRIRVPDALPVEAACCCCCWDASGSGCRWMKPCCFQLVSLSQAAPAAGDGCDDEGAGARAAGDGLEEGLRGGGEAAPLSCCWPRALLLLAWSPTAAALAGLS